MSNYLKLSNIPKSNLTKIDFIELGELMDNDNRVIDYYVRNEFSHEGLSFQVNLDLGKGEIYLNKVLSFGALAGLLHCPKWQCSLNKKDNLLLEEKIEVDNLLVKKAEKIKVDKLLNNFNVTIEQVINVINCYRLGRRVKDKDKKAVDLIKFNQNFGTGNWFIFKDYFRGSRL